MLYVQRNEQGKIIAISSSQEESVNEEIDAKSPEVVAFILENSSDENSKEFLSHTDTDLIRILEDLIALLMDKNLISLTDLPDAAQKKLLNRRQAREHIQGHADQLLVDDSNIF